MNTTTPPPPSPTVPNPKEAAGRAKCPLHLNPPKALNQMAHAMQYGAHKAGPNGDGYGEWNWRSAGIFTTTYLAAALRHLAAYADGEDSDPSSGLSHIAHVMAGMAILLDAEACGMVTDDRNKIGGRTTVAQMAAGADISALDEYTSIQIQLAVRELPPLPPSPPGLPRWILHEKGWNSSGFGYYFVCDPSKYSDWSPRPNCSPSGHPDTYYLEAVK